MAEQTTSPNVLLKDTREAKGITLEIVHEATKIPLDALKAIEQGYSVKMLTPFYYRGFIKIYAEFLGLDPNEVFRSMKLEKKPMPPIPAMAPFNKKPKAAKPIPKLGKPKENVTSFIFTKQNQKLVLMIIAVIIMIFVFIKIVGFIGSHIKFGPKQKNAASVKEEKIVQVSGGPLKIVRAESSNLKVQLAVRAMKDSWIQVKADGKVVFAMTMQKGDMETWTAYNQIEVSGKNINELDWEVNGKHIGTLGSSERWAKKAVISRQGLMVKK